MTFAQEAEIGCKEYKGLNDDDPSVMQVAAVLHSDVLAEQWANCSAKKHVKNESGLICNCI